VETRFESDVPRLRYVAQIIERIQHGEKGRDPKHPNLILLPRETLKVGIYRVHGKEEEQIGSYERNYPSLYRTFCHFRKNGQDYELYSPTITATRVLRLPSCEDLGGEPSGSFCPVDFFVPWHVPDEPDEPLPVDFGLVAGCVWGDDASGMKIHYLDLREVEQGIIKRDDRFGEPLLPPNLTLEQATNLSAYLPDEGAHRIGIAVDIEYDLLTGKRLSDP
jgi:hypothetical protein